MAAAFTLTEADRDFLIRLMAAHASLTQGAFSANRPDVCEVIIRRTIAGLDPAAPKVSGELRRETV